MRRRKRLWLRRVLIIIFGFLIVIGVFLTIFNGINQMDKVMNDNLVIIRDLKDDIPIEIPNPKPIKTFIKLEKSELPVIGASGYASVPLSLYADISKEEILSTLSSGTGFTITEEVENMWLVQGEAFTGWVESRLCLINLPDVIPSIIYDNRNTYASMFKSGQYEIPSISDMKLYDGKDYNQRLCQDEFIMPILYHALPKIYQAQQNALEEGDTLILREAYRPKQVQDQVQIALENLANIKPEVKANISSSTWNVEWFIYKGISNHQVGYAIDTSLGKILKKESIVVGSYTYENITEYKEYIMPTPFHDLSIGSIRFTEPVPSLSPIAWKEATFSITMNEAAMRLHHYCTHAGLTPLASEWWHFHDIDALGSVMDQTSVGDFIIRKTYSKVIKEEN